MTYIDDLEVAEREHDVDCNAMHHGTTCTCGRDAALSRIKEHVERLQTKHQMSCPAFDVDRQLYAEVLQEREALRARLSTYEKALREIAEPVYDSRGYGPLPSWYRSIARQALTPKEET